jgi:predicted metal-binding membrane protein
MTAASPAAARPVRDPAPLIWGVAAASWIVTFALLLSGGIEAGSHDHVLDGSTWPSPTRIAAFLGTWAVMVGAMMLPTTTTMARLFTAVSARQPRPVPGRVAFYAAYLLTWCGFALVALGGDTLVHAAVDRSTWLAAHDAVILGGALLLAGAYQLSPLKDACLRACRSPLSMIGRLYRRGIGGGWRVGLAHAANCLGCCWALMLVMFASGVGSLAWMLGLTAVMTAEKTSRYGVLFVRPVAYGMMAAGLAIVVPAVL